MENLNKLADLFEILCRKYDQNELGKKVTQNMFYFFERKGINLNLRYGIHFFGPYSSKLDNAMHVLESEGIISIDTSGITHRITLGNVKKDCSNISDAEADIASSVIEIFFPKSPYELEALATMDYIANSILSNGYTEDMIIEKFKEVKGEKFKQPIIEKTMAELKSLGFIAV